MVSEAFWQGIREFNQREFYACHDTLEALWMDSTEPEKTMYQGILQIAVACYHLENQNWRGAVILLGEGIRRLVSYQPSYGGVDIEKLVAESALLLKTLQETEPEEILPLVEKLNQSNSLPKVNQGTLPHWPKIVRINNRD